MSGRGKRASPSAKSDAGGARASPSLLKYAISKSRTSRIRNLSGLSANSSTITTRNMTNASALMDISNTLNTTSADSSMTGTEAKKMAALARFKAMEADITPRTAINQFVEANQSQAQTPAQFFATGEVTKESERRSKRRRVGDKTSLSVVSMEATIMNEDNTGNLSSDISDTTETS